MFEPQHGRGRQKIMSMLGIAAAAATVLAGCSASPAENPSSSNESQAPQTIRIAMTSSATNLAVWVAEDRGYFDDHGIDAKIEIMTSPSLSKVPQVLGKQYDIAQLTGPQHIVAADAGLPIVAVAGGYIVPKGNPNTVMMASPESGIKTAKDLIGKRIVVPTISGNTNTAAMNWLIQQGVKPDQVNLVEASSANMPDLLKAGQVDAGEITSPYVGILTGEGYVTIGEFLPSVADPVHMSYYASDKTWAEGHKDAIERFRAAKDDAAKWIADNPSEAIDVLMAKTKVPAEMKKFVTIPVYTSKLTVADLDAWLKAMKVVTGFTTDLKMKDLIFDAN